MQPISNVAVIGAGRAGRSFALRCVQAGLQVVLEDVLPSKLRLAEEQLTDGLAVHDGRLRLVNTVEDAVRDADLAIDFMPDELESKLEIFSMLDRMAPPRTILCTPIERLSLTDLASCTYRGDRCVGLRGDVNAAALTLVHGRLTDVAAVDTTSDWLRRLGYNVRLLRDVEEPMLVKNIGARP